ncbi:MAG: hypothetical protein DWQ56_15045 [Microcystis aeruginosa DA14]|uniref:Uncharacterized protein n=1 Tax=Microcystis aeruginosa DA14 TaxID=1987506 RepID=A0A3E0M719_MICAE|nr:MAG: hypothetical protein DWQ56_15045 [Microcystis aeruginosa DA14]
MVIPSFEWQLFQDSCDYPVIVTYIAVLLKSNPHLTRTPIGDTYSGIQSHQVRQFSSLFSAPHS